MHQIIRYFQGEKSESWLFIGMGVISLILAIYFIAVYKTLFWKGVAVPFICVALIELVVGYTIVTRSPKDIQRVSSFLQKEPQKISSLEIPRMEKVLQNFVVFRYVEIALICLGIVLMYWHINDNVWKGIGLGLFIQASIVLSLDFFAERRGKIYISYLTSTISNNLK